MTADRAKELAVLLSEGERLGWVFRDRRLSYREFPEPAPALADVPDEVHRAAAGTRSTAFGSVIALALVWLAGQLCLGCTIAGTYQDGEPQTRAVLVVASVGLAVVMGTLIASLVVWRVRAGGRAGRLHRRNLAHHTPALAGWQVRRDAWVRAEQQRVDGLAEWGAARPPAGAGRIDVVGGSLWGWEALLTVFGTSTLATRGGLTVVDLSGELVCGELLDLAAGNGIAVELQRLPADLAGSDLLTGLDRGQLVNTLVESMHGGAQGADRATRTMDHRVLDEIVGALGGTVSVGRIVAALRVALDAPGPTPDLTGEERRTIADELFADEYRRRVHDNLRRIESFLYPLRDLGRDRGDRGAARLTCLAVATDGGAFAELLKDLLVQWLAHRITAAPDTTRTLVVVGADDLHRRHLERVADICDRRSVRLMMLFRHLREASLQVLGAGSVAFMKLGNHEEATRAADFIGRQHRFLLTSLTTTLGGSQTHTESTSRGTSSSVSMTAFASGRTWGASNSYAQATNWTTAEAVNRVYEHTVEPRTLQDLPDYAMLLVESAPGGPVIRAVECNPDIVSLPRASMAPLE